MRGNFEYQRRDDEPGRYAHPPQEPRRSILPLALLQATRAMIQPDTTNDLALLAGRSSARAAGSNPSRRRPSNETPDNHRSLQRQGIASAAVRSARASLFRPRQGGPRNPVQRHRGRTGAGAAVQSWGAQKHWVPPG